MAFGLCVDVFLVSLLSIEALSFNPPNAILVKTMDRPSPRKDVSIAPRSLSLAIQTPRRSVHITPKRRRSFEPLRFNFDWMVAR